MPKVAYNTAVKLFAELAGRAATLVLALLVANRLGEAAFGRYSYALALAYVLAQLSDVGLQVLLAREVAISGRQARPLVRTALRLKLWFSVPVVVLWLWIAGRQPDSLRAVFLLLGLALLAQTFLEFVVYIYRGQQRLAVEALLLASARLATAGIAAALLFAGAGLVGVGVGYLVAVGSVATWGLLRLRREGWFAAAAAPSGPLLREALPLGIATFLSIAYTRLAIFMLEARLGDVAVAHYSAAHRLVEPTQIVPAALLAAIFPAFSQSLHHNPRRARRLGLGSSLLLAVGGLGVALLFWLLAPLLIPFLYGPAFGESVPVLQVLALSALPAYVNYSLTHILIARNQQLLSSIFVALMLCLHGVVSWLLIPTLGPLAPAISVTFAELFLLTSCIVALRFTAPRDSRAQTLPSTRVADSS